MTGSVTPEEFRTKIDAAIRLQIAEIASLIDSVRGGHPDAASRLELYGKAMVKSAASAEVRLLLEAYTGAVARAAVLGEEKRRLEALYASGILFSSETETRRLLATAIDVVMREIGADSGFIVLMGETGEETTTFSRNIEPADESAAKDLSMSVIGSAVRSSRPVRATAPGAAVPAVPAAVVPEADASLARSNSVVRLGISAVICVPLVTDGRVLGAVYLDRRNRDRPFTENDLSFLISFARQIVRGIVTSEEFSHLQEMLISDASMQFSGLRERFDSAEIAGSSRKLFEVLKIAAKIAATDAPVILLGENGTGKDLLAKAIHRNSRRHAGPFVTINCGAIPHDLLESELFGFESGAFTGAQKAKPGKVELAEGGTLFLDELGELSLNLQAKLLRVLQTKEIERLGGVTQTKVDVRFIAATNRDLAAMIEESAFREDLYYRLKVIELTMPPLRERREDIGILARHFLNKHAPAGKEYSLASGSLDALERYHWPGNVRELENVIHRSVVLAKSPSIDPADLPPEILQDGENFPAIEPGKKLAAAEEEFRKLYILRALRESKSVADAARTLGINRTHFYRLLSQLGIEY